MVYIKLVTVEINFNSKDYHHYDYYDSIEGLQGQLWTEVVRNPSQAHSMIFPRLLAFAERAWHEADWESEVDIEKRHNNLKQDFSRFAHILGQHKTLRNLEKLNIEYYLSVPGVR